MLILSRRCGEKIIIGNREVEMVVISYDHAKKQVKLGFEADKKIKINREEIHVKLENEQKPVDSSPELATENTTVAEAANDAGEIKDNEK